MPYSSNSDLPPAARKYSDRCQTVFRRVFNENHADGEEKAFRVAHSAARRCMEAKSVEHQALPSTKFNIFSGLLKAYDEDGRKKIKTVASSTIKDRAGDEMSLKAINQMASSAHGMTVFLNHSYNIPEDVFGVVTKAQVIQREEVWDLDFDIDVEDSNPRALATHKSIERGVKLGTSIGCKVEDAWKEKDGHVVIDDVLLLEASIVGIPANPRSFVQYAVKALEDAEASSEKEADRREEADTKDTQPDNATKAREEGDAEVANPPPAESVDNDTQPDVTATDVENPQPDTQEPEAAQEGQPTAPESAQPDGTTKDIEPEKKPAIPASDLDSDVVGDEAKALLAMKQDNFTTLLKMVETTTHELVETKKALFEAQKSVKALERERDEANANVDLAKQFVQKLSELPIGRRASHAVVISDFQEKFAGIYDPDFIKMLTSGETPNG